MKNVGVCMSVFFLVFGSIIFFQSLSLDYYSEFGPGPGFMPMWASGILIFLAIINLVISFKKNIILFSEVLPKGESLRNVLACVIACGLFIVIVPYTGFIIASMGMLFALYLRGYKWKFGLGLTTVVTFTLFWVFKTLLNVPIPVNGLGW
ncbi:tripartite tricarboxylate transporter TctB family protein [Ammoniphilus sp. CFH 90114]|uniref:tripartite tricarboxylate transporter TctB family protein n=1 Tax=Ammoniphilus sp. CFH 90114 TaxID=2493665 RepID=UPI0013E90A93|nr:tripartite tricarboxylate transporter TctB family protein [Ammoniphilus sp. CFH 90114]